MTEIKLNELIGKNVKKYRLIYNANGGNMSQRELASIIGVSTSLIGALESKKNNQGVSLYNLYKISEALNVPMYKFFEQ